eukprot:s211_g20.t1
MDHLSGDQYPEDGDGNSFFPDHARAVRALFGPCRWALDPTGGKFGRSVPGARRLVSFKLFFTAGCFLRSGSGTAWFNIIQDLKPSPHPYWIPLVV